MSPLRMANSRPAARRDSPWPDTRGLLVDLRFGEPDWRVVAAVLRAGDERLCVVFPELADVPGGGDRDVHELAGLFLHPSGVDVEERLAVLVQGPGPRWARVVLPL